MNFTLNFLNTKFFTGSYSLMDGDDGIVWGYTRERKISIIHSRCKRFGYTGHVEDAYGISITPPDLVCGSVPVTYNPGGISDKSYIAPSSVNSGSTS